MCIISAWGCGLRGPVRRRGDLALVAALDRRAPVPGRAAVVGEEDVGAREGPVRPPVVRGHEDAAPDDDAARRAGGHPGPACRKLGISRAACDCSNGKDHVPKP